MSEASLALAESLRFPRLDADDERHDGPVVSIVIVTRNGLHHLERLFASLRTMTNYRNVEVVVVDNASTDGTLAWLRTDLGLPLEVLENADNHSFSEANNQGIAASSGELVLVLNNDIEPMHADWLTRLVIALTDEPDIAAVGPLLVYPERDAPPGKEFTFPDLSVQHAGVGFELAAGRVRARNLHTGEDPRQPVLRATRTVGALTAACLLVRRSTFEQLGGFNEAYFYGSEDWDLSLRLRRHGQLLMVGRSVLYHHEYGTQGSFDAQERTEYRRRNHRIFNGDWGAAVRRQVLLEALGAEGTTAAQGVPTFVMSPDESPVLRLIAAELRALAWRPHEGSSTHPPTLELLTEGFDPGFRPRAAMSIMFARADTVAEPPPRVDLVIGVGGEPPRHWPTVAVGPRDDWRLDPDADVVTGAQGREVTRSLASFAARPRFALRTCAPDRVKGAIWGDTYLARSLAGALARRGYAAHLQTRDEWDQAHVHTYDVVLHVRGLDRYRPRPGAVNVLWIISHADRVTDEELDDFDQILIASSVYAERLRVRTRRPVTVFHQATDTRLFKPMGREARHTTNPIAVVANARWPYRRGPRWLMELGWDFSLFGSNWDKFKERRFLVSDFVPNDELADVYSAASVVVADQWAQMGRDGFVANRLFDVAASGGFALSDAGPGVVEIFGDLVPTYTTRADLHQLLLRYVDDQPARNDRAQRAMRLVREHHSFDARAGELLDILSLPTWHRRQPLRPIRSM